MADLGANVKKFWMKSMEAIGNTASNIASSTKSKVDEMNLVNRRNEIIRDFANQAYALWQKGEAFPKELDNQLRELSRLDDQLNDLRAERLAGVNTREKEDASGQAAAEPETEETDAPADAESGMTETGEPEPCAETETAEDAAEEEEEIPEEDAEEVPVIRVETPEKTDSPEQTALDVNDAIQNLFDGIPSAAETAEKVNSALDSLSEGLKQVSDGLDESIDELTARIQGETSDKTGD